MTTNARRPAVILDCDPGHDDAIAIVVAAQYCELLAITTVAGNAPLARTTPNALTVCQIFGIDVPVHPGADRPLVAPPSFAPHIHGASGLGGPTLPPLCRESAPEPAVEILLRRTEERPDVWIIATGPLTNLAHALRIDPALARRVAGIAVMGGGTFGNRTPMAEFNIWADPEAADVVFSCGAPLRMVGLDVTHHVLVGPDDEASLRREGGEALTFVADLYRFFAGAYRSHFGVDALGPLHDPCAVLAVTHPHLFTLVDRHVVIETHGRHTRGMTVMDRRGVAIGETPNVAVAEAVDADAVKGLIQAALRAQAGGRS